MKIVVDSAIPFISNRFPENTQVVLQPGDAITKDLIKDARALVVRTRTKCNRDLLEGTDVRLVTTATIGTDHIDTEWCEANGIEVKNAPGCNAPGVAQYVLASLLKTGFDPDKHILGIIGYGNVGKIVAAWAREMGIETLISDAPLKEEGNLDVDFLEKEDILAKCDAITLHVPLTDTGKFPTRYLISDKELEQMKPGAFLINSSRGGVVDEKALKKAIRNKGIRAIIDVWENEPEIDSELVELSEISTPHIAGYSTQGKKRATRMALEALRDSLKIPVDLSGLECVTTLGKISPEIIKDSYNPLLDSSALREDISKFEYLRNNYSYRNEPLY